MRKISQKRQMRICAECGLDGTSWCATPECSLSKAESRESVISVILIVLVILGLCAWVQELFGVSIPFID